LKTIPLTQNKFVLVDDADFKLLNQWKWHAKKDRWIYYAERRDKENKDKISMHRQILGLKRGDGIKSDHKDRNGLNNQRYNLRTCTNAENARNKKPQIGGTSQYKGVCWDTTIKSWRAYICYKGHQIYLGAFDDEADAAKAYDRAAEDLFGEFAYLNFPKPCKKLPQQYAGYIAGRCKWNDERIKCPK